MKSRLLFLCFIFLCTISAQAQLRHYRWYDGNPFDGCGTSRGFDVAKVQKHVVVNATLAPGTYILLGTVGGGQWAQWLGTFTWDGSRVTGDLGVHIHYPSGCPWTEAAAYVNVGNGNPALAAYGGFTLTGGDFCTNADISADPPREHHFSVTYYVGSMPPDAGIPFDQEPIFTGNELPPPTEEDDQTKADATVGGDRTDCPMATYSAFPRHASLTVTDTPIRYQPAFGPSMGFTATYLQRDRRPNSGWNMPHMGPNWNFSWSSWLEDYPTSLSSPLRVRVRGGGAESYTVFEGSGTFSGNRWANSKVVRVSTTPPVYERRFDDGSKEVFSVSDGATTGMRRLFLTEVRDAWGNAVTLTYTGLKLTTITDATGHSLTLGYDGTDPLRITSVTDPLRGWQALPTTCRVNCNRSPIRWGWFRSLPIWGIIFCIR